MIYPNSPGFAHRYLVAATTQVEHSYTSPTDIMMRLVILKLYITGTYRASSGWDYSIKFGIVIDSCVDLTICDLQYLPFVSRDVHRKYRRRLELIGTALFCCVGFSEEKNTLRRKAINKPMRYTVVLLDASRRRTTPPGEESQKHDM